MLHFIYLAMLGIGSCMKTSAKPPETLGSLLFDGTKETPIARATAVSAIQCGVAHKCSQSSQQLCTQAVTEGLLLPINDIGPS